MAPCASCGRLGLVLGVSLYECQLLGRIADDGVENRTDKGVRIRLACSSLRSLGRRSCRSFRGRQDERRLGSGRAMNISWLSKLPAACEYGIPSRGLDRGRTYHDGAEDGLRYDGPVEHKRATQGRAAFLIYQNATLNKIWWRLGYGYRSYCF